MKAALLGAEEVMAICTHAGGLGVPAWLAKTLSSVLPSFPCDGRRQKRRTSRVEALLHEGYNVRDRPQDLQIWSLLIWYE